MGIEISLMVSEKLISELDALGDTVHMTFRCVTADEAIDRSGGAHRCGLGDAQPPIDVLGSKVSLIESDECGSTDRRRSDVRGQAVENSVADGSVEVVSEGEWIRFG